MGDDNRKIGYVDPDRKVWEHTEPSDDLTDMYKSGITPLT